MKKISIFILFASIFLVSVFYIFVNINRLETDIFSLINFKDNQNEQLVLKSMQDDLSNEFLLVSDSKEFMKSTEILANKTGLFEKFSATVDIDTKKYLDDLGRLKLALLNRSAVDKIINKTDEFFKESAESFLNQFIFRPLSARDDFFALATHSSMFDEKIRLNISDMMLEIKSEDGNFFLVKARLKPNYDPKELIKFYQELKAQSSIKNYKTYISSGALYGAFAKMDADKESLYMSLISLALTSLFLLLAFRNFSIFNIVFIAIFGFACGFCASLLLFDQLHVMVVIISTSLVGLMFDFALHWLGKFKNQKIQSHSIQSMLKIFILGLFITMSGYAVFILAPLELLRQVAVFSFFTLFGAFLFTYFCLPLLLEGKIFSQSIGFSKILIWFHSFCILLSKKIGFKFLILLFIISSSFLMINFSKIIVSDNIRDYSNSPQNLLDDSIKIAHITGANVSNLMIVVRADKDIVAKERALIKELKNAKLIQDYSAISKIFLSQAEQDSIKELFKKAKIDSKISGFYQSLGIDEELLKAEFKRIVNLNTLSVDEILSSDLAREFRKFMLENKSSIIYADGFIKNNQSSEILAKYNAFSVNFVDTLNQNFTEAKHSAVILKIAAFCIAFVILWLFFGLNKAFIVMSLIALGVLIVLCGFVIFNLHVNIFVVFGLILASAVGIDYMIFAMNQDLVSDERIFGILAASLTSFISFFMLSFSSTNAISLFGLCVSLSIVFYALAASILSVKSESR
ncbi:putative membrane protein [Campylobacter sp. RM16192]|nr:putative membrane protein [Campylobacter sp. RM16192]